jgi:hypothetical protein
MISRATHILCEDFRPEEGKKLTLLGVFAGEKILMGVSPKDLPEGVLARLASVCIVSTLFVPPGPHVVRARLVAPNGEILRDANMEVSVEPGGAATLITKFSPFEVRTLGEYVVKYDVGDSETAFQFDIQFGSAPAK